MIRLEIGFFLYMQNDVFVFCRSGDDKCVSRWVDRLSQIFIGIHCCYR